MPKSTIIEDLDTIVLEAALSYETDTHVIHTEPRISAAKLAEFVVADPSRQKTIVKQAKIASKAIQFQYNRVRSCVLHAFTQDGLSSTVFSERAVEVKSSVALEDWQKRDNKNSALALEHLLNWPHKSSSKMARVFQGRVTDGDTSL